MTTATASISQSRFNLYAWQQDALADWRASGHRGIVEAVTGTGKTRLGLAAIWEAHQDGYRSVVLMPSIALQDQWIAQLRGLLPGLAVGRWGNGHHDRLTDCDVVVAVVNSAVRQIAELRSAGLIVADECHQYGSREHRKALAAVPRRLGLTTTLERSDEGVDRVLLPTSARWCTASATHGPSPMGSWRRSPLSWPQWTSPTQRASTTMTSSARIWNGRASG